MDEDRREFEPRTLEVDEPGVGEVHVMFVASALCHSDFHLIDRSGDGGEPVLSGREPIVAGHEGAGIIETVGPP